MNDFLSHLQNFDIRFRASPVDPLTIAWRLIRIIGFCLFVGWAAGNFLHVELRKDLFPQYPSRSVPSTPPAHVQ